MSPRWEWLNPAQMHQFQWDAELTPFSSFAWPAGGALIYLLVIGLLVAWRHNKPGLDMTQLTRAHNLVLVMVSLVLSYGVWSEVVRFYAYWLDINLRSLQSGDLEETRAQARRWEVYLGPWYSLCCHRWCTMQPEVHANIEEGVVDPSVAEAMCPSSVNPVSGPLYWWLYMTYIFKYYDMFDTVLLALKGRLRSDNLRGNFLHLFHHATVPLCAWMGFQGRLLMPLWMGMGINNLVHCTMYSYYLLRSLGFRPWWRRYLTLIQTSQFALGAVMTMYGCYHFFKQPSFSLDQGFTYTRGCDAEASYIYSCLLYTSDAADEEDSVDLGGRRIIKKKK
eukprot:TRINITY_DN55184_c0_g1_i2.p1 TRINITY_DN55184_c0_g1~~TRINITY_DN55184_c0_g1_i2.p1  ORF type:complete len:335 (-),score=62.47 TRINITY_DN55184_c0_g1_i2:98-1102(-)